MKKESYRKQVCASCSYFAITKRGKYHARSFITKMKCSPLTYLDHLKLAFYLSLALVLLHVHSKVALFHKKTRVIHNWVIPLWTFLHKKASELRHDLFVIHCLHSHWKFLFKLSERRCRFSSEIASFIHSFKENREKTWRYILLCV